MAWGWRGYGGYGMWPGRGPFSYLPPWQRPGWYFGRGACRWLFGNPWLYATSYYTPSYYLPYRTTTYPYTGVPYSYWPPYALSPYYWW